MASDTEKQIVILHISDLHFGHEGENIAALNKRTIALNSMSGYLDDLEPEWRPNILCVTGDIGWKKREEDYIEAKSFITGLMSKFDIQPDSVFLTPGNHDLKRPEPLDRIPTKSSSADKKLQMSPGVSPELEKLFEEFTIFSKELGIPPYLLGDTESYLCGSRSIHNVTVSSVNSAWFSRKKKEQGKLWLGLHFIEQMEADGNLVLRDELDENALSIVLLHHPKEWLHNEEIIQWGTRKKTFDYLCKRAHFLFTGHTHDRVSEPDQLKGAWHISGGAFYQGDNYFNSFQLVRIDEERFHYKFYEFQPGSDENEWMDRLNGSKILKEERVLEFLITLEERQPRIIDPPSSWLRPYFRFIPLIGREEELDALTDWRDSKEAFGWKVVTGEGGMGKTRLAHELARQSLRDAKWDAGFLSVEDLTKFTNHSGFDEWSPEKPTLIMVDYAAGKVEPLKNLIRGFIRWAGENQEKDTPPLRLLLLERHASLSEGWLEALLKTGEGILGDDIQRALAPVLELEPPIERAESLHSAMVQIIRETFNAWHELNKNPVPEFSEPDEDQLSLLAQNTGAKPLYLQMAALQAAEQNRALDMYAWRRQELVESAVNREQDYIRKQSEQSGADGNLTDMIERAAAILCLTGPMQADDRNWLDLIKNETEACGFPQIQPGEVVRILQTALGESDETTHMTSPILPDVIASAYAARIMNKRPNIREDSLTRTLELAGLRGWENVFRIRQDTYQLTDESVKDWVTNILAHRSTEELLILQKVIQAQNPAFVHWTAILYETLLKEEDQTEAERAHLYNNLGIAYSISGRREEAIEATERAVEIGERLAVSTPAAYEPDLAASLDNLGIMYNALGRREEALKITERAVEIYDRLTASNPVTYEPDLAMSLNNLGIRYSASSQREEALEAAKRSVGIRERLAALNPTAYESDLASSLINLGSSYSALGQHEEALEVTSQAVERSEHLAASNPAVHEPCLAVSLNNLGNWYRALGRHEEAFKANERAAEIYERLAASNPAAYEPDLAMSLGARGTICGSMGRHESAVQSFGRGVHVLRPHFLSLPQAFAQLMTGLTGDYLDACKETGLDADAELLGPIVEKLRELQESEEQE